MKTLLLILFLFFEIKIVFGQEVQILEFKTTNENSDSVYVASNAVINLDYRKSHILISYKDIQDSVLANYEIQLMGFDDKWLKVGKQTYANYINLFGGEYIFKVRNVRFPKNEATIKFKIEEAFWQKGWFIPVLIGYLLLVAGIIFYFFQSSKFNQKIRLQQVRNDISADLHDDVGSTLSNISFLTEIAKSRLTEKPEEISMLLDKIATDSKETMLSMRGMIWTINPENDLAKDFFEKVENYLKELLSTPEIHLEFDAQLPENLKLRIEIQRNLFLIFKEIANNIIKYANASTLKVVIRIENDWLMIQTKDNGGGFDFTEESDGNGLRNMKHRMEQLNGIFEVDGKIGVRSRFLIPLT
jgi:signal transduction histidine kinase